jgi:hypothetical protein
MAFGRDKARWELTVGMFGMTPWVRGRERTLSDAVKAIRAIRWGFGVPDPGEPDLSRTLDISGDKQLKLFGWLEAVAQFDERIARKQRHGFSFDLGDGYFTTPSGEREGPLPTSLTIRPL